MISDQQLQAEETLVRLLGRREHSAFELQQKLRQRGFADTVIATVLAKAQQQGWQSDARYTEIWLRQALASGNGWLRIKANATGKGIDEQLLQQALRTAAPDWQELCFQRLCKKFGEQAPETRQQRDKIMRHLLNRGFRFDEIKAALQQLSDMSAH
ncbi:regulatory protein RecX [Pseudidiomarina insulisalsae]|uniref:Regulatory protein RecX n=1 Tax=Pseudidiomarina insulisalsae TaxID=575789 RepID=A0A432YHX1_9GAMM|nr:regulatory protein RecX [Pseudidiomarina insulisalsae]RUO60556.1 RecX family transcriptional regulator [Pseudidiomarina insulisalsae]